MKKLSLKNLKLEANDLLQRNQLKSILGGYGPIICPQKICNENGTGDCHDNPEDKCGCTVGVEGLMCTYMG